MDFGCQRFHIRARLLKISLTRTQSFYWTVCVLYFTTVAFEGTPGTVAISQTIITENQSKPRKLCNENPWSNSAYNDIGAIVPIIILEQ